MADGLVDIKDCINIEIDSQPDKMTDRQTHRYKTERQFAAGNRQIKEGGQSVVLRDG